MTQTVTATRVALRHLELEDLSNLSLTKKSFLAMETVAKSFKRIRQSPKKLPGPITVKDMTKLV